MLDSVSESAGESIVPFGPSDFNHGLLGLVLEEPHLTPYFDGFFRCKQPPSK
jgi:hypothetical protein